MMDGLEEFTSNYQGNGGARKRDRSDADDAGGTRKPKIEADGSGGIKWAESSKKPRKSAFADPASLHNVIPGVGNDDEDEDDDLDFTPDSDDNEDDDEDAAYFENLDNLKEQMAKDGVNVDDDDEFDDSELLERLGNLDDANQSEHHSFHANSDGGRGNNRRPRGRREETNLPPGCDRAEAVEKNDGPAKLDKLLKFRGYDLAMTRKLCGEDIQRDPREIQLIQKVDRQVTKRLKGPSAGDKKGDNGSEDYDDESSVFGKPGNENFVVARNRCRICQHAGLPSNASRAAAKNAYTIMLNYDLCKYGYASDESIFQEMTDVFNREQLKVAKSGGEVFYISVDDVRDCMSWHNFSNPMRIVGRQIIMCKEIIRELRDQLFGTSTGGDGTTRRVVSRDNLKILNVYMKKECDLNREFMILRSQINEGLQTGRGSAFGLNAFSKSGTSRHLSSGPTNKTLK